MRNIIFVILIMALSPSVFAKTRIYTCAPTEINSVIASDFYYTLAVNFFSTKLQHADGYWIDCVNIRNIDGVRAVRCGDGWSLPYSANKIFHVLNVPFSCR